MTLRTFDCLLPKLLLAAGVLLWIHSPCAWAERGVIFPEKTDAYHPEKRVALVIGNSNYQEKQLPNAANDAKKMALVLQKDKYGFTVIHKQDIDHRQFKSAIRDFKQRIHRDGVSLFYYAGHGMQIEGHSFSALPTLQYLSNPSLISDNRIDKGSSFFSDFSAICFPTISI